MQRSKTILLLILPTMATACRVDREVQNSQTAPPQTAAARGQKVERRAIVSLADSIAPLIDRFNADKAKVRFVTILSPT
ncbi:MAG: hypothetical protein IIB57_14160 [Planctomycetes bacterium]|nr:hypothetical protein [Planctomycetota bacterium]